MKPNVKNGCYWGCGLLVLVLLAVVGSGTWYAVRMTRDFKEVEKSEQALIAATGAAEAYLVPPDGLPPAARVEAFLAVREGLVEWRAKLEGAVAEFQASLSQGDGLDRFLRTLRAGTEIAPVYAGFWAKRNGLLLEQGMGPGEYAYLYRLLYWAWLGHDPLDGVTTPAGTALAGGEVAGPGRAANEAELAIQASAKARQKVLGDLRAILESASGTGADPWLAEAGKELAALQADPDRRPWTGGPAASLDGVFGDHRARLERTYSGTLNPVEAMFTADAPGGD